MHKHAISIKWSDEDNGFIATIPGIKSLSAFGNTREQALSELNIAAKAYLESLKKTGRPLPEEDKIIPYSGQIRLRMPKSLHAALSSSAENEGVSLNTYIITLLSERRIERELMNKALKLETMLEIINFSILSNSQEKSNTVYKIKDSVKKYREKNKKR